MMHIDEHFYKIKLFLKKRRKKVTLSQLHALHSPVFQNITQKSMLVDPVTKHGCRKRLARFAHGFASTL